MLKETSLSCSRIKQNKLFFFSDILTNCNTNNNRQINYHNNHNSITPPALAYCNSTDLLYTPYMSVQNMYGNIPSSQQMEPSSLQFDMPPDISDNLSMYLNELDIVPGNLDDVTPTVEFFGEMSEKSREENNQKQLSNRKRPKVEETDVYQLNPSTMDSEKHARFLQTIKQQTNSSHQKQQDTLSIQLTPPPTPSSDYGEIPSPMSDIESKPNLPKTTPQKKQQSQAQTKKKPRKQYSTKSGKPRLYKFLREILDDPTTYPCIEWEDKLNGRFKFLDSSEVARLWGFRKNKPAMKYENFARSLRTYIAKGILKKPRNKLVYCFAYPENE